jgi:hypothetical protein
LDQIDDFALAYICRSASVCRLFCRTGQTANIVLILADDLGYGDPAAYETKIATPN